MRSRLVYHLLAGFVVVGAACGPSLHTVAYTPQPERIENPAKALAILILANTVQGCVTDPVYSNAIFIVKFVCMGGAGNTVLRPDQIASIELLESAPWYRVRVRHSRGAEDFIWDSKSLDDAQHIADAIQALAVSAQPAPEQPAPASTKI